MLFIAEQDYSLLPKIIIKKEAIKYYLTSVTGKIRNVKGQIINIGSKEKIISSPKRMKKEGLFIFIEQDASPGSFQFWKNRKQLPLKIAMKTVFESITLLKSAYTENY